MSDIGPEPRHPYLSASDVPSEPEPEVEPEPDPPPAHIDTAKVEAASSIYLSDVECRVLGAMIEKEAVTPDVYPMTTNAMVTACNQKTSRDPVVAYSAVLIDTTLVDLRQRNLVRRVHTPGSRSTKHRHTLDEALSLEPSEMAVLSVLMLRGDQTVGEIKQRTDRQFGFEDLDAAQHCLDKLGARPTPLVRQLARLPGHKESRWQHLLGDPSAPNADQETSVSPPEPLVTESAMAEPSSSLADRVRVLESEVATLQRQLTSLAAQLGETLE